MIQNLTLRRARPDDLAAVDALLARSYPRLLKADYPPSIMVTIVPVLARAKPGLLASGRYFVVADGEGRVMGAGGYSLSGRGRAEIRHVATDPDATRQGIGRQLMLGIFTAAEGEGVTGYDCMATRTAVPFYEAMGFVVKGPVSVPVLRGMAFPAILMRK
jgi:GNAT superfamily N-acetyltransferase